MLCKCTLKEDLKSCFRHGPPTSVCRAVFEVVYYSCCLIAQYLTDKTAAHMYKGYAVFHV